MTGIPSVGDILLLSSLAWKIGTAFTSGRSGAPAEFQEVENELESLTQSITMLADTLETDDSILERADDKTKEGLAKILDSCQEVNTDAPRACWGMLCKKLSLTHPTDP